MKTQQCDVSIILPTLRPEVVKKCLDRLYYTTYKINYEIILVTPIINIKDKLQGCKALEHVTVVEEQEKAGVSKAYELAIPHIKGDYIFLLSDDQLIQTDCLLNLMSYSKIQEIDRKKFIVTGPRYSSIWGNHWDETIFGIYYPCNPFFHREILKDLDNIIFDTHYINYYGDPDFALRARNKGYLVMPCPTAWMENTNAFDEIETERRDDDFNNDHNKFVKRWEEGFDVPDSSSAKINRGKSIQGGGIASEFCARIIHHIVEEEYEDIVGELALHRNSNKYYFEKDYAQIVFAVIVSMGDKFPTFLESRNYPLSRELLKLMFNNIQSPILNFKTVASKVKYIQPYNLRNIVMTGYIMYLINIDRNNKDFTFIEYYKGTNIKYNGKFYDTTYNIHTDTFAELIFQLDDKSNQFKKIDYLELSIFESYLKDKKLEFMYIFNALEYFTTAKMSEKRSGGMNAYTWGFK